MVNATSARGGGERTSALSYRHRLPDDLAVALREARFRRGLGLREAAEVVGVSAGHLSMMEHGDRCPSLATATDLIARLSLDADLAARLLAVARPDAGRSWQPGP